MLVVEIAAPAIFANFVPGQKKEALLSWYFVFFFISGFCSVLYELVWLRLSMAQFGVTTAMISIVLSVFMAGLGLGSWASGVWIRRRGNNFGFPTLRLYAAIELLIGTSAILAPYELRIGHEIIERMGSTSSIEYYLVSGIWVALTLVPWCALMGATIPVAMLAIDQLLPREAARSFSFLYMANVAGAVVGTVLPLFLIEILGFHGTLKVGAVCNGLIAVGAFALAARKAPKKGAVAETELSVPDGKLMAAAGGRRILLLLFATGLTAMGMEVVWVREFTPYLGTVVYAFASILAVYLGATLLGSRVYRSWSVHYKNESALLWALLAFSALLPLYAASPGFHVKANIRILFGIAPFTGLLGFITPMLVDRWALGDPAKAGKAYALNVLGCILGPLLAGFVLLPWMSTRWALVLFALPWLFLGMQKAFVSGPGVGMAPRIAALLLALAFALLVNNEGYDERPSKDIHVLRD